MLALREKVDEQALRVARKDCMEGQARIPFYVFGGRVYLFYAVCSLTIVAIVLFLSFFFFKQSFPLTFTIVQWLAHNPDTVIVPNSIYSLLPACCVLSYVFMLLTRIFSFQFETLSVFLAREV